MVQPVTVALVGAGHRTLGYAKYALNYPDRMKVVAVADPSELRRAQVRRLYGLSPEMCFPGFNELAARPRLADAVINGTMDAMHHASSLPLLRRGYHMLLEKPIARTEGEVRELIDTAAQHQCTVMICHVLRYAPFYAKIKELLAAGEIGELVTLHSAENVGYAHMACAFVRGRWSRRDRSNPMLLAKCCHDLDLIAWYFSGVPLAQVASVGGLKQFRPENAPAGAALRCLDGCQVEAACPYSARNYVTQGLGSMYNTYAFEAIEGLKNPTDEQKLESLRTDNPFGRCVWHCDNDVVDHQNVVIEFANGATASHDLFCAAARPSRTIHLLGSKGEIEGDSESGRILLRKPDTRPGHLFSERQIALEVDNADGHGGGDERLVEDFVRVLCHEPASAGSTRIQDSLTGHLIAFAADRSMREGTVVKLQGAR